MKNIRIKSTLLLIACAAVFIFAAFYDFNIASALYSPTNLFGIIMENICFIPLYIFLFLYPLYFFYKDKNKITKGKILFIANFSALYCVSTNTVIFVLKQIWQRTRFHDMAIANSFELFTPWYQFGNGGSSFPSGHTAAACGILILLLLPHLFTLFKDKSTLLLIASYIYIAFSALSRLILGRHFLSDTVASTIIASLIFFLLYSSSWCKKSLANLKTVTT